MKRLKQLQGGIVEHWITVRQRENKPIVLEGNVPRMSPQTMIKLNDLRNKLLGTSYSLQEVQKMWLEGEASVA